MHHPLTNGFCIPAWQGLHGVWQLTSPTCPATFVNNATLGQRQLYPAAINGTNAALTMSSPGTFYFTSPSDSDCANGEQGTCAEA